MVDFETIPVDMTSVPTEQTTTSTVKLPDFLPKKVAQVAQPFHIHHGLVGIGLVAAGVAFAVAAPVLRPVTRLGVGALGIAAGVALLIDDWKSHMDSGCGLDSWFNFTPCPEVAKVAAVPAVPAVTYAPASATATITVVKRPEKPST